MAIRFYESIRRVVSDYTLVASDEYIGVGQREVGVTLTLPAIGDIGQMVGFVIKDESGQANALNITLQASGVEEIQGNSTYTVNVNYGSVEVFHNGTMWIVRASNDPQILPVNAGGTGANTAQGAVDNLGLDIKDPVTVSAKTNIDLSAIPDEVNGVTLDVGDSVNLWLQTDATENGVYTVVDPGTGTDGVWERRSDFNTSSEIRAGVRFLSLQGNSFSNVYFVVLTNEPEIGVDNIEIAPQNNADPVIDAYGNTVFGYSYQESATNYVRAENTVAESAAVLRGYSDTEDHVSLSLEGKGFGRTWTGTPLIENLDATTITTAGDVTYTPVQVLGGLMSRDPNGADRTDTLPSAADIIAYIPQSFQDLAWTLRVHNTADADESITVAGGTGVTMVGNNIVRQGEVAVFYFVITNDAASSEAVMVYRVNQAAANLTDLSGNLAIEVSPSATPVNHLKVETADAGGVVALRTNGASTHIPLLLGVKGMAPIISQTILISQVMVDNEQTAGDVTYSAQTMFNNLINRDPNGASRADTTASAANIIAAFQGIVPGAGWFFTIKNTGAPLEDITLSGGAGVTLSGSGLIEPSKARTFYLVVDDIGSGTEAITLHSISYTNY